MAKQWSITREEQDGLALQSQQRAAVAQQGNLFDEEIVPVTVPGRKPVTVTADEYPKHDTTLEGLSKLRPCFITDGTGTVTPGNASGINDGAAAIVVASETAASAKGLKPLARVVSTATGGVDPKIMGAGPIPAVNAAVCCNSVKKLKWSLLWHFASIVKDNDYSFFLS